MAGAQQQAFDPRTYQERHVGEPTRVLVLGTLHLAATPTTFNPAVLDELMRRLEGFDPDAIAIEALSGRSTAQMLQYEATFPGVAEHFNSGAIAAAALARATVNLEMPAAEAEARRTLAAWPDSPTPEQRRRLTSLFAASGELFSALVQWQTLPPAERIADENVSQALVDRLARYETWRGENAVIAVRLAVRLGLDRVYPTDDQADDPRPTFEQDFRTFAQQPWYGEAGEVRAAAGLPADLESRLSTPAEALSTYRLLNAQRIGVVYADTEWLAMINRQSPNDVGRERVAMWETRNLRMVANIREVAGHYPGGRVLVIVGAAHKPWFDHYLSQFSDIELVDTSAFLE